MQNTDTIPMLFDAINDPVLVINSDYEIENMNRKGKDVFGGENINIQNIKCYDLICHKSEPDGQCPLHCINKGNDSRQDFIIQQKGHFYSVDTNEWVLENGEVKYVEVLHDVSNYINKENVQKEITDEYQALNEEYLASVEELELKNKLLEHERHKYELLFSNMNAAFAYHEIILDNQGKPVDYRFLECNKEFEQQTGLKREDILGKRVLEVMPDIEKIWIENYGKVALTGEPIDFTNYAKKLNKYYEVRCYAPEKGFFVVTFFDITQRIADQKLLENTNHRLIDNLKLTQELNEKLEDSLELIGSKERVLQTVFNNAPSIMMLMNENAEIIQLNKMGFGVSEMNSEQVLGIGAGDMLHCVNSINNPKRCGFGEQCENCKIRQTILDTIKTGKDNVNVEVQLNVKDGDGQNKTLDILVSSTQVNELDKIKILVTIQDITDIRKNERVLQQQNKQIQHLFDGAKLVLELNDFEKTARKLFDYCKEMTGATSGYVALLNENGDENEVLFLDAGGLPCSVDTSLPMPIRGLRSEAYFKHKAVCHNNFMQSEHIKLMPEGHVVLNNVLFAPLVDNKKAVGLIGLANKPTDFTPSDLKVVTAFGELASIALSNSLSKQKIEKYNEELTVREEKYRALYDNAPLAYQSLNINGNIKDVNPQWLKILGYNKEDVLGKWFGDFLHPDLVSRFKEKFAEFKRKGEVHNVKYILKKKDGSYVTVSFEGCIGYTPEGAFKQTYCTFKDITKQQIFENELIESRQTYQCLVDNIYDLVCELDEFGRYTFLNNRYKDVLGYKPEELMGENAFDLMHPDDLGKASLIAKEIAEQERDAIYQWRIKRKNGSYGLFECKSTIYRDRNNRKRTVIISQDITENKKHENLLKEQKIMFETMFNTINEGVVITNAEREIVLANKGMEKTFGYKPGEILGEKTKILYADEQHFVETGNNLFNKNAKVIENAYVTYYKDKNNRIFPGETFGSKLYNIEGEWIGNVGIMRDITERLNFIEDIGKEKEKAEKADRLKSAFLANMSHEIRTPLNGIIGFTDILARKKELSENQRLKYADIISKSSENLLRIVNDILDISALENGSMEIIKKNIDLNHFLDNIYNIFDQKVRKQKPTLQIQLKKVDQNIIISTDESRLNQIFINLLDNALKFTDEGEIAFGFKQYKSNKLLFFVEDSGIGINKQNFDLIFDRFRQAEFSSNRLYGGNGLGLCIIKELLKLLNGEIWLDSEPGKGTCFYFTLPYDSDINQSKIIPIVNSENALPEKLKILVVEDDEVNIIYFQELFVEMDVDVRYVQTGKQAIAEARKEGYDVILMDIRLPDMSGFDVTSQIRKFNTEIPIIAQTAYAMKSDEQKAYDIGCNDYISKPIDLDLLIKKIAEVMQKK